MTSAVVVLNAGSSSIKFALYGLPELNVIVHGSVSGIGSTPVCQLNGQLGQLQKALKSVPDTKSLPGLISWVLDAIADNSGDIDIKAVGHRVVHGGQRYVEATLVDDEVIATLESFIPFVPLHEPYNIAGIRAASTCWPGIAQIACFDTAFHRTQKRLAQLFALPRSLTDQGIVKYGFHGLSYEYIASVLPEYLGKQADGRVIVAHLGHGASMCAMRNRKSLAHTMGFSALDGLMMGKRCGALDAGVVLHLIQQLNMSPEEVHQLLNQQSGLLGVSGISDDVKVLEQSLNADAIEALDLFAYKARQSIGSLATDLAGLDTLVFTAGIGEHSANLRQRICQGMQWLGIELDEKANVANTTRITTESSQVSVLVIPTDEELSIARATSRTIQEKPTGYQGIAARNYRPASRP